MTTNSMNNNQGQSDASRTAVAYFGPLLIALFLSRASGGTPMAGPERSDSAAALFFAGVGLISWFLGLRWFRLPGLGLRGKRPLYASIGFATLGWIVFLIFRFYFVSAVGYGPAGSSRSFIFLLLFEAFAVQLWLFGLIFRTLADWRGPMTAAVGSGLLFGGTATLLFQESFSRSLSSLLFFVLWGVLFGLIRLRTGSILGGIVIQAMQSFSAWVVIVPETPPAENQLQMLYLFTGLAYIVLIWRLWPKTASDYRV